MTRKILVVDDNADIVSFIKNYFQAEGYEVLCAYSAEETLMQIKRVPDIVLLDVNLPDQDGFSICAAIREQVSCPIIFLTARIEDMDKIEGFSVGGDDYVTKPFNIDVLGARVASHLRRENRNNNSGYRKAFHDIIIDYSDQQVFRENEEISFTRKEYEIIALLSKNPGRIYDRERIYELIWGYDSEGESSSVTEHIKRIRQKLKNDVDYEFIETVWGVGYRWNR